MPAELLNPIFRNKSWQDTSAPPNLVLYALGPGLIALALQQYIDVGNQAYHRESMKGQAAFPVQTVYEHPGPPAATILNLQANEQTYHRETMRGQLPDPPNITLALVNLTNPGVVGPFIHNPVFSKRQVQDTSAAPNLVINLAQIGSLPFVQQALDQPAPKRDVLAGQAARYTVYLPQPEPFTLIQDTLVFKNRSFQQPFMFPNVVVLGIPASALPFVERQSEDLKWRGKETQATYDFPNAALTGKSPTSPIVQILREDMALRGKKTQEPYVLQNFLVIANSPLPPPQVIVGQSYEHLNWRGKKTQEHFDYPNLLINTKAPPPAAGFRVQAVTAGWYNGTFYQPGDVFDLNVASDFSDSTVRYQLADSATIGFGWMLRVAPTTPLFCFYEQNQTIILPVPDPLRRFVY